MRSVETSGNVKVFPDKRTAARTREETQFLPAALEIVEMPPSPTARMTIATISVLFLLALIWATFGQVDIVAVAQGRVVASGHSKVVQPFETAIVRAIHVRDGQTVQAGDLLIDLDATASLADSRRIRSDLAAAQLDGLRLRALLDGGTEALRRFSPGADADPSLVSLQRQLMASQAAAHQAKIATLDRQRLQREAERATHLAVIDKLKAASEMVQARFDIRDEMSRKQLGSKITFLDNKQALVENQMEIAVQQSHVHTVEAALAALLEMRAEAVAEFQRTLAAELSETERKIASLREEFAKADQRSRQAALRAPIDGTVQQLAIHTVGGVVTAAQPLLVVVPTGAKVEVEAMISNRDVGFVTEGQIAEVKIEAFDFTRYGLLRGRIDSVSRDAIQTSSAPERGRSGEAPAGDARGADLSFAARIALEASSLDIEGRSVNLGPGMAVTVEIKTGQRSVLSYLLSPIAKARQSALRER